LKRSVLHVQGNNLIYS